MTRNIKGYFGSNRTKQLCYINAKINALFSYKNHSSTKQIFTELLKFVLEFLKICLMYENLHVVWTFNNKVKQMLINLMLIVGSVPLMMISYIVAKTDYSIIFVIKRKSFHFLYVKISSFYWNPFLFHEDIGFKKIKQNLLLLAWLDWIFSVIIQN